MPIKLTKNEIDKITKVSEIPGFPYKSYSQLIQANNKKDISIGAAQDLARQWTMQAKAAPKQKRVTLQLLTGIYILIPLALLIYSLVSFQFISLLLLVPFFLAFFLLNPTTLRVMPLFKVLVVLGLVFVVIGLLDLSEIWSFYLGLSILIPWYVNKRIYKIAVRTAINEGKKTEVKFMELFKYNILAIQYPNGKMIWFWDLVERDNSPRGGDSHQKDELKDWDSIKDKE